MSIDKKQIWPVLKRYNQDCLGKIAMPIGGIGTGTVSLGGRGDLRDWEIMNRPAKGFVPRTQMSTWPFFAIYTKQSNGIKMSKLLEGPLESYEYEGSNGSSASNHGLPRFRNVSFEAAYPLAQINLSDKNMPVKVRLKAFNPLIPNDVDSSGLPAAILTYQVTNTASEKIDFSICGSVPNFIGCDGSHLKNEFDRSLVAGCRKNVNTLMDSPNCRGIFMSSEGVDKAAPQWGSIAIATTSKGKISRRLAWQALAAGWTDDILDFWDDFSGDGILEQRTDDNADAPVASVCVSQKLAAGETKEVTFLLTWHFPNRYTWTADGQNLGTECECRNWNKREFIGNQYAVRFADAWDAATQTANLLPKLEDKTVEFVRSVCQSDMPVEVLEAALFNLSTLRSQTCFITAQGRFFGWEGCCDHNGCCWGSCTHVWNYEQSLAFLFGGLSKDMRDLEFNCATDDNGLMSFRIGLPLEKSRLFGKAAADGQMGCIMKLYRDWQLSGDDAMLNKLWPKARKAMEFAWIDGGWDGDCDGVMEGCQHNTMDVEYYGPNPQMQLWYLGALKAITKMAAYIGEKDFGEKCEALFQMGSKWTDENLFNGSYYEHKIMPPKDAKNVSPYLSAGMGSKNLENPDYQLGAGCLVDQLVGQFMSHICGLGYLTKPANIRKTLKSIMKYNYHDNFYDSFNHFRSYVVGDESALFMASYPKGNRPKVPFPYFNEVMTGFEYTAAIGMLYEGQTKDGVKCIKNIRERYDGKKRSPFNEAECGHHYARAMAVWGAIPALSGFNYSGVDSAMRFNCPQQKSKWFWSNGCAYGTVEIKPAAKKAAVVLNVKGGILRLKQFTLNGFGTVCFDSFKVIKDGKEIVFNINQ